jgi:hypothetical protein
LYLVLVYEFGTVRGGVSMCMVAWRVQDKNEQSDIMADTQEHDHAYQDLLFPYTTSCGCSCV